MDSKNMRQYMLNFSLDNCTRGNQGYNRVLLQLIGFTGHGKSSFINTCKYVIDEGSYKVYAKVAKDKPQTMQRSSYRMTDTITLVDNRGYAKMDDYEIGVIYAQLGNFLPLEMDVEWQNKYVDMLTLLLDSHNQNTDFIVPVLVYSAKNIIVNDDCKQLKKLIETATKITGVVPTVVITNELSKNLAAVKETFRILGVKNMHSLENYTEDDNLKTRGKHETILQCLYGIIKDVEFQMEEERNPDMEMRERKMILSEFAHERDMKKKEEELKKEAEKRMQKQREESERQRRETERETERRMEEMRKELEAQSGSCVIL